MRGSPLTADSKKQPAATAHAHAGSSSPALGYTFPSAGQAVESPKARLAEIPINAMEEFAEKVHTTIWYIPLFGTRSMWYTTLFRFRKVGTNNNYLRVRSLEEVCLACSCRHPSSKSLGL